MGEEQARLTQEVINPSVASVQEEATKSPAFEIPHADRVITVFGVTGAIGNLISLCPVPEEDRALFTQEQVNSYVERLIAMDESQTEQDEEPETEEKETEESKKKLN